MGVVPPGGGRETSREQDHRNRPGDHQLGGRRHGGRQPPRHHQPRGRADDTVGRRVRQGDRRAPRRPGRQAAGRDEPGEHRLLDQALHGPQVRRGLRRAEDGAVQGRRGPERGRPRVDRGQALPAARGVRDDPAEDAGRRRAAPRGEGDEGGHHGARLLQRLPTPGHEGRGADRRARGAAHRQRADRRRPGLRSRQEEGRDDRGLRLRRRDLRHLGPRGGRGCRGGEGHERRHPPRRRQPRPEGDGLDRRRVQEGPGDRPLEGQDGAPAAEGGRGEGEVRAQHDDGDGDQPPLRHRRRLGPQAPGLEAHPRQARAARGRPPREDDGSRSASASRTPLSSRRRSTRW